MPQSLAAQGFASHGSVLAAQGKAVGYHGDEFTIGGLALDAADGVAEELLQHLHIATVPGYLNGVADGTLHTGGGGVEALGHLRVEHLCDGIYHVQVIYGKDDGLSEILID